MRPFHSILLVLSWRLAHACAYWTSNFSFKTGKKLYFFLRKQRGSVAHLNWNSFLKHRASYKDRDGSRSPEGETRAARFLWLDDQRTAQEGGDERFNVRSPFSCRWSANMALAVIEASSNSRRFWLFHTIHNTPDPEWRGAQALQDPRRAARRRRMIRLLPGRADVRGTPFWEETAGGKLKRWLMSSTSMAEGACSPERRWPCGDEDNCTWSYWNEYVHNRQHYPEITWTIERQEP